MAGPLKFEKIIEDYICKIQIQPDFSEATIEVTVGEGETGGKFPDKSQLEGFLKEKGIILGIKEDVLQKISNEKLLDTEVVAASELPAQNGKDSKINYILENDTESMLSQDEHGNIDFKELNWFKSVSEGDVIAEKIPFTMGIDGYNIKGEKIQGLPGKDTAFKYGANVKTSDNDLQLIATKSGRYENINGKVSVNDILDIRDDVGPSVGNLDFDGDIVVSRDVKAGYSINAKGSLEVGGVIEAANINVAGDLVVKGGIKGGENTQVRVGGSVVCKFIENTNLKAFGDITADFIIHSNVMSGGNIKVDGRKSLISGGEVTAKDKITVNVIGSHMATKTNIVLGVDIEKSEKLENNKKEVEEIEKELKKRAYQITVSKERMQRGRMDTIQKIEFTKQLKDYSNYQDKLNKLENEIDEIEEELREFKNSSVIVKDRLYPGVRVSIIENSKYFSDSVGPCKIVLEEGEVKVKKG